MKSDYIQIKENWYMAKYYKPENKNKIQLIVKVNDIYLFMVSEWLTQKEVENINLNNYEFRTFKGVLDNKEAEIE
ncbi:MAG: hypothetical protein J6D03_03620 [Clostridia bacterium]|nr:hypothetical protein [Clostridia bacterium]